MNAHRRYYSKVFRQKDGPECVALTEEIMQKAILFVATYVIGLSTYEELEELVEECKLNRLLNDEEMLGTFASAFQGHPPMTFARLVPREIFDETPAALKWQSKEWINEIACPPR